MTGILARVNQIIANVSALALDNPHRSGLLRGLFALRDKILASIETDRQYAERRAIGLAQLEEKVNEAAAWWAALSEEGKNNIRKWGDSSPYE
jgi:hypothetical protein